MKFSPAILLADLIGHAARFSDTPEKWATTIALLRAHGVDPQGYEGFADGRLANERPAAGNQRANLDTELLASMKAERDDADRQAGAAERERAEKAEAALSRLGECDWRQVMPDGTTVRSFARAALAEQEQPE